MPPTLRPHAGNAPDDRTNALLAWLDATLDTRGERRVAAAPMPAAASFRRFTRVTSDVRRYVAIDAPPERENNEQFVRLSTYFRRHGINVPEVLAADMARGFLLVTDFGDRHFADVYGTADEPRALARAIETLVSLQSLPRADAVPPYTRDRLEDEFDLFATWLCDGLLGVTIEPDLLALTRTTLVDAIAAQPRVCVHRDYHSRNLMWREDGTIGVLDFQDALWGPLCYDLASLLRDCYHRFDEEAVTCWRGRYLELARAAGVGIPVDDATFARWLDWTGLQRQVKAVGIFSRLELRDGRDRHLGDVEPVLERIVHVAARYPSLAPFADWVEERIRPTAAAKLARYRAAS